MKTCMSLGKWQTKLEICRWTQKSVSAKFLSELERVQWQGEVGNMGEFGRESSRSNEGENIKDRC